MHNVVFEKLIYEIWKKEGSLMDSLELVFISMFDWILMCKIAFLTEL
jgi:hypothetical protein